MRRIAILVLAVVSALTLISFAALAAGAQTSTTGTLSPEANTLVASESGGSVSEGSITKERASAEQLSIMEPPEP